MSELVRGVSAVDQPMTEAELETAPLSSLPPFVKDTVMAYFKRRLSQALRDADFALPYVKQHARTRQEQDAGVAAVRFKCDALWRLDALHHADVDPGIAPPGAFRPNEPRRDGSRARGPAVLRMRAFGSGMARDLR